MATAIISATRLCAIPEPNSKRCCDRCGIEYSVFGNVKDPQRARFCKDCRTPAAELGWCPKRPSARRQQQVHP